MPSTYLVDQIFPAREVHVIAGPSGGGKTTWLIQFIHEWQKGEKFHGHASHPVPFLYISADRSLESVERLFERMRLPFAGFPIISLEQIRSHNNLALTIRDLCKEHPSVRVLFIEGLQSFTPDGRLNDYKTVSHFLVQLILLCRELNLTLIGVAHTAKTKEDETYRNPRQRINGSVAWAAFTETIVVIEPIIADDPNNSTRSVMILPRNAPERAYQVEFRDGRLVEKLRAATAAQRLQNWLTEQAPGTQFTSSEIMSATSIRSATTFRVEIELAAARKLVEQIGHGSYRVCSASQPN